MASNAAHASLTRRAGKVFKALKNTATESPGTLSKKLDLQTLFAQNNNNSSASNFAEKENLNDFFGTIGSIGRKRSRSVNGDKPEISSVNGVQQDKKPKLDVDMFNSPFLVFAIPLSKLMAKQKATHPELAIPLVVKQCLDYMRQNCMDLEGVFRICGVHDQLKALRSVYDAGLGETESWKVLQENQDPHNVAGLLKLFLRSLPEPILTYERFDPFVSLLSIRHPEDKDDEDALQVQLHVLRQIVASLPPDNHALLATIIGFLHELGNNHKETTKMEISSLARVLGPNLMWAPPTSSATIHPTATGAAATSHADCQLGFSNVIGVITLLIETHPAAFQPETSPLLPEIEIEIETETSAQSEDSSSDSNSRIPLEEEEVAKQQRLTASSLRRKLLLQQLHQNGASVKLKLQEDPERLPASPVKPSTTYATATTSSPLRGGSRIRKSLNPANFLKHAKTVKDRLTEHLPQSLMPLLSGEEAINHPSCKTFYFDAFYFSSTSSPSPAEGKATRKAEEFFFHNGLAPSAKIDADKEPLTLETFLSHFFNGSSGCHEVIVAQHRNNNDPNNANSSNSGSTSSNLLQKVVGGKVLSVYKPTLEDLRQLLLTSDLETESPSSSSSTPSSPRGNHSNNQPRLRTPLVVVGNTLLIGFHAETYRKVFINQQLQTIWQKEKTKEKTTITSTTD